MADDLVTVRGPVDRPTIALSRLLLPEASECESAAQYALRAWRRVYSAAPRYAQAGRAIVFVTRADSARVIAAYLDSKEVPACAYIYGAGGGLCTQGGVVSRQGCETCTGFETCMSGGPTHRGILVDSTLLAGSAAAAMTMEFDEEWAATIRALYTPNAQKPHSRSLQRYVISFWNHSACRHDWIMNGLESIGWRTPWDEFVEDLILSGREAVEAAVKEQSLHELRVAALNDCELSSLRSLDVMRARAERVGRLSLTDIREQARLLPANELVEAVTHAASRAQRVDHELDAESTLSEVAVPQFCSVSSLSVPAVRALTPLIGPELAQATWDSAWWQISRLCYYRVRAGGTRILYSDNGEGVDAWCSEPSIQVPVPTL